MRVLCSSANGATTSSVNQEDDQHRAVHELQLQCVASSRANALDQQPGALSNSKLEQMLCKHTNLFV